MACAGELVAHEIVEVLVGHERHWERADGCLKSAAVAPKVRPPSSRQLRVRKAESRGPHLGYACETLLPQTGEINLPHEQQQRRAAARTLMRVEQHHVFEDLG